MRWVAAIAAVVLAYFCKGYVQKFVPTLANFLTNHYFPRVGTPVFYIAWVGLAVIFFVVFELILHIVRPRSKADAASR